MLTLKEQFIYMVVGEVVGRAAAGRAPRILDLGCGTAVYVPALLQKFPQITYVGVEPIPASYEAATSNLKNVPNTSLHFQLGYDHIEGETDASFDLVLSLSVLEHIRHLNRFIALSARYVRMGGLLVHRYDLGHALYPHSLKERLHVWLGNTLPAVLPERQFVRYVPESEVREHFEHWGITPLKTTYHQMPNHKRLEKQFKSAPDTMLIDELFDWEMRHQTRFLELPVTEREALFPAVAVWGERR